VLYIGDGDNYVQGIVVSTIKADFEVLNKVRGEGGLGSTDEIKEEVVSTTSTSKPSTAKKK